MPEATEIAKPEFKSEKAFEFVGPKKTIDVVTAQVSRGSTVGTGFFRLKSEDLKWDDCPLLWDPEVLMEEVIRPYLDTHSLKSSKIATAEASTFQKNEDGSFAVDDKGQKITESVDENRQKKKFLELTEKLSTESETASALKKQHEALMEKWGKMDPKTNYDGWMNAAKELHLIQSKRDAIAAAKAAKQEADAAQSETPAVAEAA